MCKSDKRKNPRKKVKPSRSRAGRCMSRWGRLGGSNREKVQGHLDGFRQKTDWPNHGKDRIHYTEAWG